MRIVTFEVKTFVENAYCECGSQEPLSWDGLTLSCNPPRYVFYCEDCQTKHYLDTVYPRQVYEKVIASNKDRIDSQC